jgi:hypothetical protein
MEAARTSETSVDNYFTQQYVPEDNSELQILKPSLMELNLSELALISFNLTHFK